MTAPLVSVCITTYNHAAFIAHALDSVLAQQVEFPIEILVGEDDSTDATRAIVERYAAQHPDVIRPFYHRAADKVHINGRPTGRRNLANNLVEARGEFVILLDGDDFWLDPHKLATQVRFLREHPQYAGCFHNAIHVDEHGTLLDQLAVHLTRRDFSLRDLLVTNPVPTMSCLFRNRFPKAMPDWFFTTDMGDWPVHLLTAQQGPLHYLPVVMAAYRVHDGGRWQAMRDDHALGLYSQVKVWRILLAEADFGEDAHIRALVDKNYRRLVRHYGKQRNGAEVCRLLRERKDFMSGWDAWGLRQYVKARWLLPERTAS